MGVIHGVDHRDRAVPPFIEGASLTVRSKLPALTEVLRNEPGCVAYEPYLAPDCMLVIVERWADQESCLTHRRSAAAVELGTVLRPLLSDAFHVSVVEPLAGPGRRS
ncbi:putative quinol monooxygenase [Streptomyces brasiliensis]